MHLCCCNDLRSTLVNKLSLCVTFSFNSSLTLQFGKADVCPWGHCCPQTFLSVYMRDDGVVCSFCKYFEYNLFPKYKVYPDGILMQSGPYTFSQQNMNLVHFALFYFIFFQPWGGILYFPGTDCHFMSQSTWYVWYYVTMYVCYYATTFQFLWKCMYISKRKTK